LSHTQHRLWTA